MKDKIIYNTLAECYIDACAHEVLHCIEVENFYRTSPTANRAFAEGRCKDTFIENFMRHALEDGKVKGYENYKDKEFKPIEPFIDCGGNYAFG